jgi:uncharacterized circularly permuted ATP-grasp superfamily protein
VFEASHVRPVDDYPSRLLETLQHLVPEEIRDPSVVVLTPGTYNAAYFEHAFLAQQMGGVIEGRIGGHDGLVMMRTTKGFERVDVFIGASMTNPQALA